MFNKAIKQNKSFFAIVAFFIFFFSVILYIGVTRIYDRESRWRHGIAISQLNASKSIIKLYISAFEQYSYFLKNLSPLRGFVNGHFSQEQYRNEVEDVFINLAQSANEIYQIKVIDLSGKEKIRIDKAGDGRILTTTGNQLTDENDRHCFVDQMKSKKPLDNSSNSKIYFRHGKYTFHSSPAMVITEPLTNLEKKYEGVLVIKILLSKMFSLLSDNIFMQTDGIVYAMAPRSKVLEWNQSTLNFLGTEGKIEISDTETIHYSQLELSAKRNIIVGIKHHHMGLKRELDRLIIISVIFFSIFLGIIWLISFFNMKNFKEKNRAQLAIISSLVELTDWRDPDTGQHLKRTQLYAKQLAIQLRKMKKYKRIINDDYIENIFETAPLHDIGKVGIRDYILMKPEKLSPEEVKKMKQHVEIGKNILEDIMNIFTITQPFIIVARNIAAYHHEKYDGTGYPNSLTGEDIPLEARIFSLADVYDALRSKRGYKDEIDHVDVVQMIKAESGRHFDPDIVKVFLEIEEKFFSISTINIKTPSDVITR